MAPEQEPDWEQLASEVAAGYPLEVDRELLRRATAALPSTRRVH